MLIVRNCRACIWTIFILFYVLASMYGAGGRATPRFPLIVFFWAKSSLWWDKNAATESFRGKRADKRLASITNSLLASLMVPILATLWVLWVFRTARNKKNNYPRIFHLYSFANWCMSLFKTCWLKKISNKSKQNNKGCQVQLICKNIV